MYTILIYDIVSDKRRAKIADACLDYGLDRIQYSAFCGKLSRHHQEELMLRITDLLEDDLGNIQLFPVCAKDWSNRIILE